MMSSFYLVVKQYVRGKLVKSIPLHPVVGDNSKPKNLMSLIREDAQSRGIDVMYNFTIFYPQYGVVAREHKKNAPKTIHLYWLEDVTDAKPPSYYRNLEDEEKQNG